MAAHSEPLPVSTGPLGNGAFVDEHGIGLGSQVSITAESFGKEPTVGQLVAAIDTLHFKKIGPAGIVCSCAFPPNRLFVEAG